VSPTGAARVLVTRRLPEDGLAPLVAAGHTLVRRDDDIPFAPDELAAAAAEVDAILCLLTDRIDEAVLSAGLTTRRRSDSSTRSLKVVANAAVGYDNIDLAAAARFGVAVCNTPGVLDQTTADLAFLLVLAATRLASEAERDLRAGRWEGWGFMDHLSRDVHGGILGLVGYGRIARQVARRAEGFGMEVLHHTRASTGFPGYTATLDDLLSTSDVVSLHVPLTDATHHLIGRRELAVMKPTGVLVNTSRGPVVDEEALVDALEAGTIFAAGLDVYDREPSINPRLLAAPHTVLLPHIGSATVATRTRMARLAAQGISDVLAGRTPPNLVTP